MPRSAHEDFDEIEEILSAKPGSVLRYGTGIISVIAGLIFLLAYFVQYPDIVSGRVTLLTEKPPAPILARASGLVERVWVRDGECVRTGDLLMRVGSPGDGDTLLELGDRLLVIEETIEQGSFTQTSKLLSTPRHSLGPVHASYVALRVNLDAYMQLQAEFESRQVDTLNDHQRYSLEALVKQTERQIALLRKRVKFSRKQNQRDRDLSVKGAASQEDVDVSQNDVIRQRIELSDAQLRELSLLLQTSQMESALLEADLRRQDLLRERWAAVLSSFRQLQADYLTWEDLHVMRAPMDGCVSLAQVWSDHQAVQVGDEILLVVPEGEAITGRIQLPQRSAGKVHEGQDLTINLDSYPMYEYGLLHGAVASVAAVGNESGFVTRVQLREGMLTDQRIELRFRQGMEGNANVVTQERRLLERVFSQIAEALFGERSTNTGV